MSIGSSSAAKYLERLVDKFGQKLGDMSYICWQGPRTNNSRHKLT